MDLLEREVFDCPSRCARLFEAYWVYSHESQNAFEYVSYHFFFMWLTNLSREFVKPAIDVRTGIIAPTDEQRLKYRHKLRVFAKGRTAVPPRMACLAREYKVRFSVQLRSDGDTESLLSQNRLREISELGVEVYRDKIDDLYDPFEPHFLVEAFEAKRSMKAYNFGHLIFNPEYWAAHGIGEARVGEWDPLTLMFIKEGMYSST